MQRGNTTVIASRHGPTLEIFPAAGPALDLVAVREVLTRHGLGLVESSDLTTAHEFIAAEGLDVPRAAALADDLRAIGLRTRVVNRTGLTTSRRIGNAVGLQAMLGILGVGTAMSTGISVMDALHDGRSIPSIALAGLVTGLAILTWAAFNAIVLQSRGGLSLRVAGFENTSPRRLTEELETFVRDLPDHVARPLLERARRLEPLALADPGGEAASELGALLEDLRRPLDTQTAREAKALRDDVARARRALDETTRR